MLGAAGSFAAYLSLAQPHGESLIQYVVENPVVVWFVGPLFSALTGLVFKEGTYSPIYLGFPLEIAFELGEPSISFLMQDSVMGSWKLEAGSWCTYICYPFAASWSPGIGFIHTLVSSLLLQMVSS